MALKFKSPINSLFKKTASAPHDRIFSKSRGFHVLYCKLLYQEFHANDLYAEGNFFPLYSKMKFPKLVHIFGRFQQSDKLIIPQKHLVRSILC